MNWLIPTLHAELLKLKRTLAFRMIFVAPLLVATLQFFITWNQRRIDSKFMLWETLSQNAMVVWAIFMLPLLITLETALLNGIEHSEKQWKYLFALPIPRYTIYVAKLFVAQVLALISTFVLCLFILIAGWILMLLRPELANAGIPNYGWMLKHTFMIWLASWLIIAIHTWVSIRWPSFTLALSTGVGGTFFALFAASARIGKFYPWLLPVNTLNLLSAERIKPALILGALGGIVVATLGCIEFVRRDVSS
jgi:hypothetical protein